MLRVRGDDVVVLLGLLLVLALPLPSAGGVVTGKEAFVSPLRPVLPKHLPRFAWDRREKPLRIPLVVNVFLGGLDYNSPDPNVYTSVSASDLEAYLMEAFPRHQPACLETGEQLHLAFDLWYHVAHIDADRVREVERAVAAGMKRVESPDEDEARELKEARHEYSVPVQGDVLASLQGIHDLYAPSSARRYRFDADDDGGEKLEEGGWFKRGGGGGAESGEDSVQTYSLLILNLDKKSMAPKGLAAGGGDPTDLFVYRYDFNHSSRADAFLASGRFAVVDLSAGPSEYGPAVAGEGTVTSKTLPRLSMDWSAPVAAGMPSSLPFQSRLVQIVRSCVRSLFSPDVLFDELDTSDEVLVAIMVLRDHRKFDPLQQGHAFSIDMRTVEEQVSRLALPEQRIHFISGLHNLQEHERIAIAVERSYKTDTLHESVGGFFRTVQRNYIDSQTLFNELADTSDYLAAGLMDIGSPMHAKFFEETPERKRGRTKTRVLPVYVLSLMHPHSPLFIDSGGLFASSAHAAVVLQHGDSVMLQYHSSGRQLSMVASNPAPSIIAGLASSLSGIVPPSAHFSEPHKEKRPELLWAHGWSPFGPFAGSPYLSQVLVDHAIRNGILWRVNVGLERGGRVLKIIDEFAQEYLFDPLGQSLEEGKPKVMLLDRFYRGDEAVASKTSLEHTKAVTVVREMHKALLELQSDFAQVSRDVYRAHLKEAFYGADLALRKAGMLEEQARAQVEKIIGDLECCAVSHQLLPRGDMMTWVRALLVFIVAICGVVLCTVQDHARRRMRTLTHGREKVSRD